MGSRARPKQEEDVSVQSLAAVSDQHYSVMGRYRQSVQRLSPSPHPAGSQAAFSEAF